MLSLFKSTSRLAALTSKRHVRGLASQTATLPDLGYDFGSLEPTISAKIMEIHYTKHHQTYVTNLNVALEQLDSVQAKGDYGKMIALQSAIKFNGGGHVNHTLFWENLGPGKGGEPSGMIGEAIKSKWGSFDAFKKDFNATTAAVQGSGWGWLSYNPKSKGVGIVTCANQDPCSTTGTVPLLGIDVWEHAYYLDYLNARPKYLEAIWDVVNWDKVEERFTNAK